LRIPQQVTVPRGRMSGMDLNRDPQTIAAAAAEEIRALNHKTLTPGGSFTYPSNIYDTVGSLETMVERLPQALDQIGRALAKFNADGVIRMDDGSDPGEAVAAVTRALESGKSVAEALGTILQVAVQPLGKMWFQAPPGHDDADDE
jgi:hypothetical protein